MGKIYKVAIIGGGAAGLAAAAMLSEAFGSYAAVFERLDRVGKKITATGNGRGNFTNENLSVSNYHSEKSDASAFVKGALGAFGNGETVKFLKSLGVITAAEKGRIYPASACGSGPRVAGGTSVRAVPEYDDWREGLDDYALRFSGGRL